ncbi:MAG: Ig-like domain-containing protein [Granulosicoccus sp.]|nr:Ig-like domain-containing protein [Granulosicoccus sp.]
MKLINMNPHHLLLLGASLFALAGCSSDSDYDFDASIADAQNQASAASPPQALFNPDPTDPVLPFPNSIFFLGSTNGLLNIPVAESAIQTLANPQVALNQMDGFSTTSPIVTTFSEALDPATLIIDQTIRIVEVSTANAIGVTGVIGEFLDPSLFNVVFADQQLTIIPKAPLKPNTSYLVALTNGITDLDGLPLQPSFVYGLLKKDVEVEPLADPALLQLQEATASQIAVLGPAGTDPADVVLTWVFKTQSTRESLEAVKNISDAASPSPLQMIATGTTTSDIGGAGLADIWVGALDVPYYQTALGGDNGPLDVLNGFWQTSEGNPIGAVGSAGTPDYVPMETGVEKVPVLMTLPNGNAGGGTVQMPAGGWPVTVFAHGLTRSRADMLFIADAMANAGIALIAIDMPLHGVAEDSPLHASQNPLGSRERTFDMDIVINPVEGEETLVATEGQDGIADPSGEHFDNLGNLANIRDNLKQAVADMFVLRASIAGAAGEGLILDANQVTFLGISFGSIVGATALSFDNAYTAATLAVPGGGIAQLMANSPRFGPQIEAGLAQSGIEVGSAEFAQFLTITQTLVDSVDPINHASTLAQSASIPLHLIQVIGDQSIPAIANELIAPLSGTEPLANQLGLTQIGESSSTGGWVKFTEGVHGSLLDPTSSAAATQEMQSQTIGFAVSQGGTLTITDTSVIEVP